MEKRKLLNSIRTGILVILIYYVMSLCQALPFELLGVDIKAVPTYVKSIYLIFYDILMASLILILYHDLLVEKWKDFKEHHQEYFKTYFKYWFLLLGLMMVCNLLIMVITKDTSGAENQNQIIELFGKAPIYTYFSAVIFAPVVEELVFRQSIRNLIPKYNTLFIIVSGLIFGGMHVIGAETFTDFIYIIPYSLPGMIFAYVLTKSDNIFTTIGLHFVHNGILMSLQAILLIFG